MMTALKALWTAFLTRVFRGRFVRVSILAIVEDDEPGYHAYVPALRGLHVGGDTEEEALKNTEDAITAYLASMISHGEPIPIGPGLTFQSQVERPKISRGASLRNVSVPWPYRKAFEIS